MQGKLIYSTFGMYYDLVNAKNTPQNNVLRGIYFNNLKTHGLVSVICFTYNPPPFVKFI